MWKEAGYKPISLLLIKKLCWEEKQLHINQTIQLRISYMPLIQQHFYHIHYTKRVVISWCHSCWIIVFSYFVVIFFSKCMFTHVDKTSIYCYFRLIYFNVPYCTLIDKHAFHLKKTKQRMGLIFLIKSMNVCTQTQDNMCHYLGESTTEASWEKKNIYFNRILVCF